MATAEIDGTTIAYEIIGDGGPPWVVTPGGRFSKDEPGIRELANELAAARAARRDLGPAEHGRLRRVLHGCIGVGDAGRQARRIVARARPGAGRDRGRLRRRARLTPHGGEASRRRPPSSRCSGSRVVCTARCCSACTTAASRSAPRGAAAWKRSWSCPNGPEVLERNPANRAQLLALDPQHFIETLERWMLVYCPQPGATVAGLTDDECSRLGVRTLVFRSGRSDPHHTRATSERIAELMPNARLVEPPWGDDEWNERGDAARAGTGHLFERWPLLAPQLLDFARPD